MHELSVCIALLDQVQRVARERHSGSVSQIVVRLGPLSGVEAELLSNAYPLAAAGTIAERAELVIEEMDVVVQCSQCGAESTARPNRLLCGQCGDFRTRIVSGDEMLLQRIVFGPATPQAVAG
ncbi:MAG: hydrogenase maturation nickel metallochaperone HypA [Woeseiaceae bacterium]|nr:hydrogenase maturation nickel metallochaperone HypA [Woeseiaceae bacterium]